MSRSSRLLAIACGLLIAGPAHAARLLNVTFERDGKLIQKSYYQDDGYGQPADFCRMLGKQPIGIGDPSEAKASTADPLAARLDGTIVITVAHVDQVLLAATIENLNLIRASANNDRWHLPPDEVARVAQAAGVTLSGPTTGHWVSLIVFVAIAVILGFVLSRFRTPTADD